MCPISLSLQMLVVPQNMWIHSDAPPKEKDRIRGKEVEVMELSESQLQRDWRNERLIMVGY